MAKPTTITAKIIEDICTAVRAGNYMTTAAAYAGVPSRTFYSWLRRGRKVIEVQEAGGDPEAEAGIQEAGLLRELVEQLEQANGFAETRHVAIIADKARKVWQAAAWWLERRYPDRWGQRTRHDVAEEGAQQTDLLEYEEWLRHARKTPSTPKKFPRKP